jgi:hypothetical protein
MQLREAQEYAEEIELFLAREIKEHDARMEKYASEFDAEDAAEIHWRFGKIYPTIMREAFLLHVYSSTEHHLKRICTDYHQRTGTSVALPKFDRDILKRIKNFLAAVGVSFPRQDALWRNVDALRLVRNCMAHSNGRVEKSNKNSSEIYAFMKRRRSISLDHHNHVVFKPKFTMDTLKILKAFFNGLLVAVADNYEKAVPS